MDCVTGDAGAKTVHRVKGSWISINLVGFQEKSIRTLGYKINNGLTIMICKRFKFGMFKSVQLKGSLFKRSGLIKRALANRREEHIRY